MGWWVGRGLNLSNPARDFADEDITFWFSPMPMCTRVAFRRSETLGGKCLVINFAHICHHHHHGVQRTVFHEVVLLASPMVMMRYIYSYSSTQTKKQNQNLLTHQHIYYRPKDFTSVTSIYCWSRPTGFLSFVVCDACLSRTLKCSTNLIWIRKKKKASRIRIQSP